MNNSVRSAVALVAALTLAGCSVGGSGTPEAASELPVSAGSMQVVESTLPSAEPMPTADPAQAWADDMINLFLNGNSKSSFDDFNEALPHHYIESWRAESEGQLSITVANGDWTSEQLNTLGNSVMFTAGNETPGLRQVSVSTTSGSSVGHADRNNLQDF